MLALSSRLHFSSALIVRSCALCFATLAGLVAAPASAQPDPFEANAASDTAALATAAAPQGKDPGAAALIARARERFSAHAVAASVVCVRESFLGGRDTLRGEWESGRVAGERRLSLRGSGDAFEWWSRAEGGEQWRREGDAGRLRRLPPHSRKKPAFSPDVSYEDLARLPHGYLDGHRGARRLAETDSTITVGLVPGGALAALYGSLEVTLGRADALPRRIRFVGLGARPSKTLTVARYTAAPGGVFPAELVYAAGDGLSATRLTFVPALAAPARDKATARPGTAPRFAEPRWEPRDPTVE